MNWLLNSGPLILLTCSGSAITMHLSYKKLSLFYRLPEDGVCHACAETNRTVRMRVSYLEEKITF